MAKNKAQVTMQSYGIYTHWDEHSKLLPQIKQFTQKIDAQLDIEFGFIINIKKAKGEKLTYCIYHPDIPDDDGNIMAPFTGVEYVGNNDWEFYLGDTIWAPVATKVGPWRMTVELNGKIVADKTFHVVAAEQQSETDFWRHRGYS